MGLDLLTRKSWWRSVLGCMLALAVASGSLPLVAFADETAALDAASIDEPHIDNEVIVVYESGRVGDGMRADALDAGPDIESFGYDVVEVLGDDVDSGQAVVADIPEDRSVESAIEELEEMPGVAYAQPNYEYSLLDGASVKATTNDPYCNNTANRNQWYLWNSRVLQAWDYARSEGSITVAVLDTGCRLDHEDLSDVIDFEDAYDTFEDTPLVSSSVPGGDVVGHGTHVCGVLGAHANNGIGIAGASYNAKVLPIKVFSNESGNPTARTSDIVQAYDYLSTLINRGSLSDLRVVNMSLGYYAAGTSVGDRQLQQRISLLRDRGVLTVCAGGNGDKNGNPRTDKSIPSDFDECLAVTSLDRDGGNSYWSDYNQYKDISAPGDEIYSTVSNSSSGYEFKSGTSMASPIVAGTACLLWAANSSLTVDEVVGILLSTASPIADPENNRQGLSGSKGAIDAEAAVEEARKTSPVPKVNRLAGGTALGTMAAVSAEGFKKGFCDSVVVATIDGYWDALTASSLAGLKSCPILITERAGLSSETASEIARLGARTVYIAGGPAAVSEGVELSISRLSGVEAVVRLAGSTAVDTALKLYEAGKGSWGSTAIVSTSETFHDALSASPYAYARSAPVFLANSATHELDARVLASIRSGGFTRVLITGGMAAISSNVENQLSGITCIRQGGATAYETSAQIAAWCVSEGMRADKMGVATGTSYYDALTGAALCGKNNSALVLASDENRSAISSFIKPHKDSIRNAYVFGGPEAVSDTTLAFIQTALE